MSQERMPAIPADKYTDAQKRAADEFLATRKSAVFGPFTLINLRDILYRASYFRRTAIFPDADFPWVFHGGSATIALVILALGISIFWAKRREPLAPGQRLPELTIVGSLLLLIGVACLIAALARLVRIGDADSVIALAAAAVVFVSYVLKAPLSLTVSFPRGIGHRESASRKSTEFSRGFAENTQT
jgi:hypothetical protein